MDQPVEVAERALLHFFPPSSDGTISTSQKAFSESDFRSMSEILRRTGRDTWSKVPRIYTVLRLIDQLQLLDSIIADNISDFGLPFTIETLPEAIKSQSVRFKFLEMQGRVLTESLDLERRMANTDIFLGKRTSHLSRLRRLQRVLSDTSTE